MKQVPLTVLFFMTLFIAYAQNTSISVYGGLIVSRLTGDEGKLLDGNARFSRRIAFQGGVMLNAPISDRFKIHTGIGYAQRGTEIESQSFSPYPGSGIYYSKIKIDYLEFPVMLSLGNEFVYIMAGPQIALEVSSDVSSLKSEDFGIKYGIGFEMGRYVTAQLLLYHGLTNLSGTSEAKMYNRYISLAAGVKIINFRSQESSSKKSKEKKEFVVPHRTLD